MTKKREPLDLTDNELNALCLCIHSYINDRERYLTKKSLRIGNSMLNKVIKNGMERKDFKSILQPIVKFEDEG